MNLEIINDMKTIYDLELHGMIQVGSYYVTRVPGGWIYEYRVSECLYGQSWGKMKTSSAVFVPFNNEFMEI